MEGLKNVNFLQMPGNTQADQMTVHLRLDYCFYAVIMELRFLYCVHYI